VAGTLARCHYCRECSGCDVDVVDWLVPLAGRAFLGKLFRAGRKGERGSPRGAVRRRCGNRDGGTWEREPRTNLNCVELDLRFLFVGCVAACVRDVSGALEVISLFVRRARGQRVEERTMNPDDLSFISGSKLLACFHTRCPADSSRSIVILTEI